MSATPEAYDLIVIGSGPAGQKAAVQAKKAGCRVVMIERERGVGGACVHSGTIPSKTLRETAVHLAGFRLRVGRHFDLQLPADLQLASLMDRMQLVVDAHVRYQSDQLQRNGIVMLHGRGRFLSDRIVEVESVYGDRRQLRGEHIVIATGSRPRTPPEIPIDHEHVLDSDSILSMAYLPRSLVVLGAGVIACEYATIFAALGTAVTVIDKAPRPLQFLSPSITDGFTKAFEANAGCTFVGNATVTAVAWNGVDAVVTRLANGWELKSDKLLCALGRTANVDGLSLEAAGLATNARGHIPVDADGRTAVGHIFAAGDVIGPPSLASTSMQQGRRAVRAALGLPLGHGSETIPAGIYTIPEIASVGLSAAEAQARYGGCVVGRARYDELARGQISGCTEGRLELVLAPGDLRVLGAQILGEGATELIHLAQMAMSQGATAETFVESIFNFPTLAEAYRTAALDALEQVGSASAT